MTPSSSPSYRPTALERAYASHLLQTYFQTPHNPHSNDDSTTPLRIPGRQAVPFLTTSGVERTLLRLFWSIVDPEAVGTLLVRNQFHVLLRLVAMAQAHFLPPLTTSSTGEIMTDVQKIDILTTTLQDNSHLVIALPTFSADVQMMPSVAYLLATFPSNMSTTVNSNDNENSMLDYSMNDNNNNVIMSVSDAFGSLPEVEDRPLPSLQSTAVEDVVNDSEHVNSIGIASEGETMMNDVGELNTSDTNNECMGIEGDEFGGFESTSNPNSNNSDVKTESSAQESEEAGNNRNDADFGGFSDSFAPPPPPVAAVEDAEEDDDFGNFGSADTAAAPSIQVTNGHDNNVGMSAFDAFGDAEDKPLPPLGGFPSISNETGTTNSEQVEVDDDDGFGFGSFEATVEEEASKTFDDAPVDDNFGNFEDEAVETTTTAIVEDIVDAPVEDSFGSFAGAAEEIADSTEPEMSFGTFGGAGGEGDMVEPEQNTNSQSEIPATTSDLPSPPQSDDPFGSLPEVENLSLPPLTSPFYEEKKSLDAPTTTIEEDDDFGDFGSPDAPDTSQSSHFAVNNPEQMMVSNDDDFGGFESTAVTTEVNEEIKPNDDAVGNDFGAFGESTVSPLDDVDAPVDDGVGNFEGAGGEGDIVEPEQNTNSQSEIPATASDLPSPPQSDDPFGSLPEVENLPLPPLTSPFYEEKKSLDAPTTTIEVDDDFGDFGSPDAPATSQSSHFAVNNPEQMMVSNDDDFGGFESTAVTTEVNEEIKPNDDAVENDFGAFGESTVSPRHSEVEGSEQPFPAPANDANLASFSEEKKSHEDADIGGIIATSQDKADGEEPKQSFGLSAFDAFDDIEDAPLPSLSTFTPSTNNEIEATETGEMDGNNNNESFGAFGTVQTEPNFDAPADDSFGTFEGAASIAETPNADAPVDESFGTFEGVVAEIAEPEQAVSFGIFEGEPREVEQIEANVDGGEKETAEVEQEIIAQTEVPVTSFVLPSPSPSDPFGSLPEIENLPLPPLTSPPLVERKSQDADMEVEDNTPDAENDGFGDFDSVPVDDSTRSVLPHESEQMDEGAFGGFESTTPQVQATEDVFVSTTNDTNDNTIGALSETPPLAGNDNDFGDFGDPAPPLDAPPGDVAKNEEDDFGDFGEAEVPAPSLDATSTGVDAAKTKDDDFGDFGAAEVPTPPLDETSTGVDAAENEEDDFGDFGETEVPTPPAETKEIDDFGNFGEAQIPAPPLYTASEEVVAEENDDDFGDFGEVEVPAPPLDAAPTMDVAANASNTDDADDFGFGDWGSGDWQGQASEGNESAPAPALDILSGGFDAFSAPAPKQSGGTDEQTAPATPNGDNGDEFGSFEAPKSDVTQEEGSDGFVFVENTEPDNQSDAFGDFSSTANEFDSGADEEKMTHPELEEEDADGFGDFSSPANESFSAFDSGADEEKILQPKLEEDADGFGDFSSFDNGTEQQEFKEGSHKSSLSRQELIGSEYTNLMEQWANIVSTVKSDVGRGQKIIDYVSKSLPSSDRAIIFKSSKLQNHMLGLAEFVRVVRCIAATIADVFCLSDNVDLQASHLAEWNDNPIIADAIAIETFWYEISSKIVALKILPQLPQLETVIEIRARAKTANVMHKTDLCHLTLQPFVDKPCTQSSVDWNGNKYMACAANLLLHRMS